MFLTHKQVEINNYKCRDAGEKKRVSRRISERGKHRQNVPKARIRSSVPSMCGKQHMHGGQILQREKPLPRPSAGDMSSPVDRQLKGSQCLSSPLRLLRLRLLHFDFLLNVCICLFSPSVCQVYSDILHNTVLPWENA